MSGRRAPIPNTAQTFGLDTSSHRRYAHTANSADVSGD